MITMIISALLIIGTTMVCARYCILCRMLKCMTRGAKDLKSDDEESPKRDRSEKYKDNDSRLQSLERRVSRLEKLKN